MAGDPVCSSPTARIRRYNTRVRIFIPDEVVFACAEQRGGNMARESGVPVAGLPVGIAWRLDAL